MSGPSTGRRIALLSGALLVAGFLLGRLAGGGPPAIVPAPQVPVADREETARAPVPAPVPAPAPPETLGLPDPGPGPRGSGVIYARVTREDGSPVSGVTIRAIPEDRTWMPDRVEGVPPGDPRAAEAREEIRLALLRRRGTRETVSGTDGSLTIHEVGGGRYRVRGWKRGFEIRHTGGGPVRSGDHVRLVALPVVLVEARVLAPDGQPAKSATVHAEHLETGRRQSRTWSPDHPRLALPPGRATLKATAGDGETQASEAVELLAVEGETPEPVVLRLRERTGISGTVRFPPVDPFGSVRYHVAWLRIREGVDVDPAILRHSRHGMTRFHRTNPKRGYGDFAATGLPPGRYLIGVLGRQYETLASTELTLTEGIEEIELTVSSPHAGEATTVLLLDPEGRPLDRGEAQVQALVVNEQGMASSGGREQYLGEGRWRVFRPDSTDDGGGYRLRIRSREHGRSEIEYDPTAAETTVRLEAPATLVATLPEYPGSRYEGRTRIAVYGTTGRRGFPLIEKRPLPRGGAELGPLAPGDYILALEVETEESGRQTVLERRVTLTPGRREEIHLSPPPLHDLVVLEAAGASLWRLESVEGRGWRRAAPDADGTLRFPRVLGGDYLLWRDGVAMRLRIDGDRTIRFEEETLDAFRVSITDPEGAFARGGLLDGDLVVAIRGEEIEGRSRSSALLLAASESGPVELTVRRGGSRLRVTADLANLWDTRTNGGSLHPWKK